MKIGLKCPNCNNTYYPKPDDCIFPDMEKIFLRRYGQNNEGKNIEYMICCMCDSISYVQISLIKFIPAMLASITIFGTPIALISPYQLYMKPKDLNKIQKETNKIHDISNRDIASILEKDFSIPPHIFKFLSKIRLLTIDKLGLKFRGQYCNHIHRSVGHFSSDEYSIEEMKEKYDVNDRLEEIKHNKN